MDMDAGFCRANFGCEQVYSGRAAYSTPGRRRVGRSAPAEIARLLPPGTVSYHNYDLAGQVASILHRLSDGTVPVAVYYTYDEDGRRTKLERKGTPYFLADVAKKVWCPLFSLTSEEWLDDDEASVNAFAWEYDAAGNRTEQVWCDRSLAVQELGN